MHCYCKFLHALLFHKICKLENAFERYLNKKKVFVFKKDEKKVQKEREMR